jgi:hypothetical protein
MRFHALSNSITEKYERSAQRLNYFYTE